MRFALVFLIFIGGLFAQAAESQLSHYKNFYFSGPVNKEILQDFKRQNGAVVIDVRGFDEKGDCGEAIIATKLGLKFFAAPMPKEKPITKDTIAQVEKFVKEAGNKPVLLYCSTGNRSAAWLAVHLVKTDKMPADEAVNIAKSVGLKSEAVEKEVREFIADGKL